MLVSHWISTQHPWEEVLQRARHVEASGWDGVWVADHFMPNDAASLDQPMHECFSVLAGLAASVPRVRLGSLVAGNTYRHPAVLAKQAATIDHIAEGRLVLGLGAGWQEIEHSSYGVEFGSVADRIAWLDEACQVVRALRDEHRSTFDGDRYQLADAPLEPKPVGQMPLLIGASGEHKMAKVVARWADEWNVWSTPDTWAPKRTAFDRALADEGRDPSTLHRSTQALVLVGPKAKAKAAELNAVRPCIGGTPAELVDTIGQWAEAGLDELIVPDFTLGDLSRTTDTLDQLQAEVVPTFR
ncbi:MAG: LLM class flavin-dependent oxidoreductase [Acidimicrobiales bacterium]